MIEKLSPNGSKFMRLNVYHAQAVRFQSFRLDLGNWYAKDPGDLYVFPP
jgi:hypothetical protein